jgi:hypothetical protein
VLHRIDYKSYVLGDDDFLEVIAPDLVLVTDRLPEELLEPLEAGGVEARLGPGAGEGRDELDDLLGGDDAVRVLIHQPEQLVQHSLGVEDFAELVEGDGAVAAQHVRHALHLLGEVHLLLVPETKKRLHFMRM